MKKTIHHIFAVYLFISLGIIACHAQDNSIADSLLIKLEKSDQDSIRVTLLNRLAQYYKNVDLEKMLSYAEDALVLAQKVKFRTGEANAQINNGAYNQIKGNYEVATTFYLSAVKILEQTGDRISLAKAYNNLGIISDQRGLLDNAIEYYTKSMEILITTGDTQSIAYCYTNIGIIHEKKGDYISAIMHHNKSIALKKKLGNNLGIAFSYNNMAVNYQSLNLTDSAVYYYNKCMYIFDTLGHEIYVGMTLNNLGYLLMQNGQEADALKYFIEGFEKLKDSGIKEHIQYSYEGMALCNAAIGNYKKAFENQSVQMLYKDSILNESSMKQMAELEARFENEKKKLEIEKLEKAKEAQHQTILRKDAENKKQKIIIFSSIAGFIIILVFSIVLLRMFREKKRANINLEHKNNEISQKNEEITSQRDEIEAQRDQITQHRDIVLLQKTEIESSISYAKRIQQALLLTDNKTLKFLDDHFILFRPKDIVSGDFYWTTSINEFLIITVADCTGHGVPGAFMSMLGVSFLNEIVRKKEITATNQILNELRQAIIEALSQTDKDDSAKTGLSAVRDGMDMGICAINTKTKSCDFSGANNPLYIIREGTSEVEEIKGDKMPVAIHIRMEVFNSHTIKLNGGDQLYLFSDGFADQFGGERGKKFKYKPFKKLLVENCGKPMTEQKEALEVALDGWMNYESQKYEQVDDITILGLKI